MVRVRTTSGKAYEMSQSARFVELCDDIGNLAMLVFLKDSGEVQILNPEDSAFHSYAKSYNLKTAAVDEYYAVSKPR